MSFVIAAGVVMSGCADDGAEVEDPETVETAADVDPGASNDDRTPLDGASFSRKGLVAEGRPVITDLAVFAGRLYATANTDPLHASGAGVRSTEDGETFEDVLDDPASQGFLRLRVIDGTLYMPEGDPEGYDPGHVWTKVDGEDPVRTAVARAVHTFDVARFGDDLLCANGMIGGSGSLCSTHDGGETGWREVESTPYKRLKFMAVQGDRLFVSKRTVQTPIDYLRWDGDVDDHDGQPVDAVPGEANTWRWYVTSEGRLYWSFIADEGHEVRYTDDGETWVEVEDLAGRLTADFAELDGDLYALTEEGLFGSDDGEHFRLVAPAPTALTFGPVYRSGGYNAEATASMTVFEGRLWCGSSTDGHLYVVD